jgi:hypothetical protein
LEGKWFGEYIPGKLYWWRKHLLTAMHRAAPAGITPGQKVFYVNNDDPQYPLRLNATVVRDVEGWVEIELIDGSKSVVPPSRLRDAALTVLLPLIEQEDQGVSNRATPTGQPALVSDQAAARLDPTGFDQAQGGNQ